MIYRVVLTGGPCSGKSTCLEAISKRLKGDGYHVITVPETAAEVIYNIAQPNPDDYDYTMIFQNAIFEMQSLKENNAEMFAQIEAGKGKNVVIIYDRSIFDNMAYLPKFSDFYTILKNHKADFFTIAQKYDLVMALQSVASSDKGEYVNNAVRHEDPKFAAELDKRTVNGYLSARNVKIVPVMDTVEEKCETVIGHIYDLINKKANEIALVEEPLDLEGASLEVGSDKCIAKYDEFRNTVYIDGVEYSLVSRYQHNRDYISAPVFSLEMNDEKNGQFQSRIITAEESHKYRENEFTHGGSTYTKIIRFVKDGEVHQINVPEKGPVTHQKFVNKLEKEKTLVKK